MATYRGFAHRAAANQMRTLVHITGGKQSHIAQQLLQDYFKVLYNREYNRYCAIFTTFNNVFTTHDSHNSTSAITHSLKWRQFLAMRKIGPAPYLQNGQSRIPAVQHTRFYPWSSPEKI